MFWRIYQLLIIGAVACANVIWPFTPNKYLVGIIGVVAAYLATVALSGLIGLLPLGRRQRQHRAPQ
jgi:hypothetical protein